MATPISNWYKFMSIQWKSSDTCHLVIAQSWRKWNLWLPQERAALKQLQLQQAVQKSNQGLGRLQMELFGSAPTSILLLAWNLYLALWRGLATVLL
mmetsp:Transcript_10888/g.24320  ORF Transcript_10888/g.24320 Transcript_10888/m.24320 type:complete len:96 (-) Transcript_10888:212-499(-)